MPSCVPARDGPSMTESSKPTLLPPRFTRVTVEEHGFGLFDAAMNNAGASKRTRRLIRDRLWLLEDQGPHVTVAATQLRDLLTRAYGEAEERPRGRDDMAHEHTGTDQTQVEEYFEHFRPRGYAIAGAELREESACRLLALLQLTPSDLFVDLGSATGRLTLSAAALSPARALGVELSPSRSKQGAEAVERECTGHLNHPLCQPVLHPSCQHELHLPSHSAAFAHAPRVPATTRSSPLRFSAARSWQACRMTNSHRACATSRAICSRRSSREPRLSGARCAHSQVDESQRRCGSGR